MRQKLSAEFDTKMRLNAFVVGEIVNAVYPEERAESLTRAQNSAFFKLSDLDASVVHELVGKLASAIQSEIERQQALKDEAPATVAARVASRFVLGCSLGR
jgi:hypothetical protein